MHDDPGPFHEGELALQRTTGQRDPGPFHEGELALQRATGQRDAGAGNGRIITDRVIPAAVAFIARQELAVMATIDGDGRPWCSALVGPPGSFTVADPTRLALE